MPRIDPLAGLGAIGTLARRDWSTLRAMGTVAAIEKSFDDLRRSSALDRSLRNWQMREPCLRSVLTVEELIDLCRKPRPELVERKNDVIAALCRLATSFSPSQGRDEHAGVLVIWLFAGAMRNIAREIGTAHLTLEDLDSEMLSGFWEEASIGCLMSRGLSKRLYRAARRTAWRAALEARADASCRRDLELDRLPHGDAHTNPSSALERAKRAGVLTEVQAELIGATRIDGRPVAEVAQELGLTREAATMQRTRAYRRLAAWLSPDPGPDRHSAGGRWNWSAASRPRPKNVPLHSSSRVPQITRE